MRTPCASCLLGLALLAVLPVRAQEAAGAADARDVAPGAGQQGVVHVDAIKQPEMHTYRAIVAGLDAFDEQHALAPAAPQLLFVVRSRSGAALTGPIPTARLAGDDFTLPLAVDAAALFSVPRSRQAWDANAELVLSRKRREARVWPYVRSPGLAANQRRLGDLRLECQVFVTIAKKEAPFYIVALADTVFLTSDWCSFFKDEDRHWEVHVPAPLRAAVLREGERRLALRVKQNAFELPIGDISWGNDAVIDLEFAPAEATAPAASAVSVSVGIGAPSSR